MTEATSGSRGVSRVRRSSRQRLFYRQPYVHAMNEQRTQLFGKGCTIGGIGLLVIAMLAWLVTVLAAVPLGLVTILAVPPGVVMLILGLLTLGYGSIGKVMIGLLFVGAAFGVTILLPVLEALDLVPVAAVFVILVVALAAMSQMNSQQLYSPGEYPYVDESKGYDGRSGDREWIPSEEELDERAENSRDE